MRLQWVNGAFQIKATTVREHNSLIRLFCAMGGEDKEGHLQDLDVSAIPSDTPRGGTLRDLYTSIEDTKALLDTPRLGQSHYLAYSSGQPGELPDDH